MILIPIVIDTVLTAVVGGIMAILLFWAVEVLAHVIAAPLKLIPVIGGAIAGGLEDAFSAVAHGLESGSDWLLHAFAQGLWMLVMPPLYMLINLVTGIGDAKSAANNAHTFAESSAIAEQTLRSHDIATLTQTLNADVAALQAQSAQAFTTETNLLNQAVQGLYQTLQGNIANVANTEAADVATLQSAIASTETDLLGIITSSVANAQSQAALAIQGLQSVLNTDIEKLATTETQDVANLATQIPQVATDVSNTAISQLGVAAHDLVIGPWQALIPSLSTVAGALSPAAAGALNLPGVLTEPLAGTIPGILAMTIPALAAVTTEVADCAIPTCDNLGGLSSLFHDLNSGLWLLLLVALLAVAVADPRAAGDDLATLAAPIGDLARGLGDLIGAVI